MKVHRRKFLEIIGAAAILPGAARALDYPSRPLHWVIGFPPGGGTDIIVRVLGAWLAERLGQPVIIENRPGAATNIATEYVARSAPDGYTLLWYGVSTAINASIFPNLSFNVLKDIAPVSGAVAFPLVIEVNPKVPARNIAELIELAKTSPGKLTLASFGTGTISQVAGELLKLRAGIEMVHVPYKGGAQMLTDLLSGHVDAAINVVASDLPHIRSGAVRALATLGPKRLDALPDVPTLGETFPGYEAVVFSGVGVPQGTPPEIIALLNREINAGLADPAIRKRLDDLTAIALINTPAEFGAYIASESEKWAKVIKAANIRAD